VAHKGIVDAGIESSVEDNSLEGCAMIGPGVLQNVSEFFDVRLSRRSPHQKTCGGRADSTHGKDQASHAFAPSHALPWRKMCSGGLDARPGDLVSGVAGARVAFAEAGRKAKLPAWMLYGSGVRLALEHGLRRRRW
jgi:hypothetical protein